MVAVDQRVLLVALPTLTHTFQTALTTFFFSSRRRHTRWPRDWSSDVCSSDLCDRRSDLAAISDQVSSASHALLFRQKIEDDANGAQRILEEPLRRLVL